VKGKSRNKSARWRSEGSKVIYLMSQGDVGRYDSISFENFDFDVPTKGSAVKSSICMNELI